MALKHLKFCMHAQLEVSAPNMRRLHASSSCIRRDASLQSEALPVQGTVATIVASSAGDAPSYASPDGIEAAIKNIDSRLPSLSLRCTIRIL